jgi:hypothetical protein
MMKWISVKERLPEKDTSYLVGYIEDGKMHWSEDEWYQGEWVAEKEWCCGGIAEEDITHWLEIPKIEEEK